MHAVGFRSFLMACLGQAAGLLEPRCPWREDRERVPIGQDLEERQVIVKAWWRLVAAGVRDL